MRNGNYGAGIPQTKCNVRIQIYAFLASCATNEKNCVVTVMIIITTY